MAVSSRPGLVLVASSRDDARVRAVELLERAGHPVMDTVDGMHALAAATRHLPDVVVADAVLTKLDGLELATRLSTLRDTSDIPFILVRDTASDAAVTASVRSVVSTLDDIVVHVQRLVSQRTANVEHQRALRRALAAICATARERAEEPRRAPEYVHALANGSNEQMISVLVADDEARYVEANAAVCALTGYSRTELLDMSIWDLSADEYVARGRRAWSRFLRDGRFDGAYRIRRRTGEAITIRCASAANVVPGLHVSTLAPTRLLEAIRS